MSSRLLLSITVLDVEPDGTRQIGGEASDRRRLPLGLRVVDRPRRVLVRQVVGRQARRPAAGQQPGPEADQIVGRQGLRQEGDVGGLAECGFRSVIVADATASPGAEHGWGMRRGHSTAAAASSPAARCSPRRRHARTARHSWRAALPACRRIAVAAG
jgi:hypothetical protein